MGAYSDIELEHINKILDYYHVGSALSFEPTIEGISNSNFKVQLDNHKTVLLKISNDKTIEQLENEQTILSTLQQYNYKYSLAPLSTIKGLPIYQHENFYGVVFPYIEGLPPKIDNDVLVQIGYALGELHSLEIRKEHLDNIRPHDLVGYGGVSISNYVTTSHCPADFKESFYQIFPDGLKDIPYELFPAGIIHGDLYFDNSLFNQGKLVTLIDFEQSGRGRFLLDLGIAISGSCLSSERLHLDKTYIQSFLEGYEKSRKLLTLSLIHI